MLSAPPSMRAPPPFLHAPPSLRALPLALAILFALVPYVCSRIFSTFSCDAFEYTSHCLGTVIEGEVVSDQPR